MLVHFSSFSGLLNAPRTMTPLLSGSVWRTEPWDSSDYPLLLVCSTAAQGCFALSMFPANSGFSFVFFLRLGPQKCSVDKILFLALPTSSGSLEEEEKNRREWAWPDPAEWEGCSAGGLKGGKSSVSFFFFLHISISKDPRWLHTQLCLAQEAGQPSAALNWPVTQAASREMPEYRQTGNWWDAVLIMVVQRANCLHPKPWTKAGLLRAERWNGDRTRQIQYGLNAKLRFIWTVTRS